MDDSYKKYLWINKSIKLTIWDYSTEKKKAD